MADIYDLGAEFFRWEIATAVAGAIIGINAFNQPDVEASKNATKNLTSEYEKSAPCRRKSRSSKIAALSCSPTRRMPRSWAKAAGGNSTLAAYLKAASGPHQERRLLRRAWLHPDERGARAGPYRPCAMQCATRNTWLPVWDLGPRFLHSTGQAYKGGPNSGVFLQITCDDAVELPVPGQKYTFGIVKAAQARGDFQVLAERGRRALRVHLGSNLKAGLATLQAAVDKAL